MVALDVNSEDLEKRIHLWEKLMGLKQILISDFLPNAHFDDTFFLDNEKEISRIYVLKNNVSIHDKGSWQETMLFFNKEMQAFEQFFDMYKEIIDSGN